MPLFKRKPFALMEPPGDLKSDELVFQVRFTKEIFRDYQEYLDKLNLYRQRTWTCKVTGKTGLTYEEALVSERRASEKVQQFPEQLVQPVLRMVQFSTLSLKDLVNKIAKSVYEDLFEGMDLYSKKDGSVCSCKILKVLRTDVDNVQYEVAWVDKNKETTGTSIVNANALILKRLPFSRFVLKSFIRESTFRSVPWFIREELAKKYSIPTEPPEDIREELSIRNGCCYGRPRKRKDKEAGLDADNLKVRKKKRRTLGEDAETIKGQVKEDKKKGTKRSVDDLLVRPSADDPALTERPPLIADFMIPMDCVGDLIMAWDFCTSFGRLLNLSPFPLEDFEKAVCHKDSNLVLIMESHSALLRFLIKDEGEYYSIIRNKKRKTKITKMNWTDFLCDFLEMGSVSQLSSHVSTIKRGYYGLLDVSTKLRIYWELVAHALSTESIREQLDRYMDQKKELLASKRDEARKLKEEHEVPDATNEITTSNGTHALGKGEKKNRVDAKKTSEATNGHSKMDELKGVPPNKKNKDKEYQGKETIELRERQLEKEIEKCFIRTNSLGKDRYRNRYWYFQRDGRLFVESFDCKQWGYYTVKEELDALMGSLNPKGERERALQRQLRKYYTKISTSLQKRSKDIAQRVALDEAVVRRSVRVRAQPRDDPAMSFLRYVNKWKEDDTKNAA